MPDILEAEQSGAPKVFAPPREKDGTIQFFSLVLAAQKHTGAQEILDFGAGRNAALVRAREAADQHRAFLLDLRSLGARVTAFDVDKDVREHPAADEIVVGNAGDDLPFPDERFDLVVSDNTFEHIEDPEAISRELIRVLRPGGLLCARTPNRKGYVAVAARLIPKSIYGLILKKAQPAREDRDKFGVFYRMNDDASLRRLFAPHRITVLHPDIEPSYFFGSRLIRTGFGLLHAILPRKLGTAVFVFVEKTEDKAARPKRSRAGRS